MLTRSNLIIPELLVEAIQGQFPGMTVLWGTGAAIVSTTLPRTNASGARIQGGDTVKIPYFGTIGELDDVPEGDALTPVGLVMTDEEAHVVHSGKAVEISEWAQLAAQYADPYAEMARQMIVACARRGDKALIDAATASLPPTQINDLTGSSGTLDYGAIVDSRMLWGDEQADIALLTVHSKVFGNLLKMQDTTGRPLLLLPIEDPSKLATFLGIPIAVSDRNTVDKTDPAHPKYHSLLIKKGALAFWFSKEPTVAEDDDILADTHIAAVHMYWAAHRYMRIPGTTRPGVVDIVTSG